MTSGRAIHIVGTGITLMTLVAATLPMIQSASTIIFPERAAATSQELHAGAVCITRGTGAAEKRFLLEKNIALATILLRANTAV